MHNFVDCRKGQEYGVENFMIDAKIEIPVNTVTMIGWSLFMLPIIVWAAQSLPVGGD